VGSQVPAGYRQPRGIEGHCLRRRQVDEDGGESLEPGRDRHCRQERTSELEQLTVAELLDALRITEDEVEKVGCAIHPLKHEEGGDADRDEDDQRRGSQGFPNARQGVQGVAQHLTKGTGDYLHPMVTVTDPCPSFPKSRPPGATSKRRWSATS
jgi:hypothetical protein